MLSEKKVELLFIRHSNYYISRFLNLFTLLFLVNISLYSQTDKEFWFVAPEVDSANNPSAGKYDRPVILRLTTLNNAAKVSVSIPSNPLFTSIVLDIAANSTSSVDLTEWIHLIENSVPNQVQNKGLLIQSSAEITAYYEVQSLECKCNPELFALKGRNALGNEFFIPSQRTWSIDTVRHPNAKSAFDIVATQDNTQITITPSRRLIGRNAGVPFSIKLNKGQTFSSQGFYHNGSNLLNGSKVTSDKPVAVTTKEDLLFGDGTCADLAGDQLVPTSVLGMEYIIVRGNLTRRDKVVILAIVNNTKVYLDGNATPVATLNASESYEADIIDAGSLYVKTNQKVYVLHYSGNTCEVGSAVIPKLNCTGSKSVSIVKNVEDGAYILLVTKNGNQGEFLVDGNAGIINADDFSQVSGTSGEYVYCKKDLSVYMSLANATKFSNDRGAFQLGFLNGSSFYGGCLYGYFSDYKKSNVQSTQLEVCLNDSVQLDALGGVTYVWSPTIGLSNSKIANPMASPKFNTTYKVEIIDSDGCIDSAFVEVKVNTCAIEVPSCNSWLKVGSTNDAVEIGDLDVTGNQITVEALFNRTTPYTPSGDYRYSGDIVSKHMDPSDCNYLLRPRHAEITTTNGFFATPAVCDLELNKTYHVALVYNGSSLKFYRNGFLLSEVPASGDLITNDWNTKIGDVAGPWNPPPTNFTGFINEVRIWNVSKSQAQIRAGMNTAVSNPTTQTGLLAYYTFNSLDNKQGNGLWNGKLIGNSVIKQTNTACTFVADSCKIVVIPDKVITPDFTIPDTVCVNTPIKISNNTQGEASNFWSFCVADLGKTPIGENLGNLNGALSGPVFMDYVYENGNYYGFVTNYSSVGLARLDFGNSLLNVPTTTVLGNFGGVLPSGIGTEGIQVVKSDGKWYAIIVGGNTTITSKPRIAKVEFGADITNPNPIATNWGNIGNLDQPLDLHIFKEGNKFYGFTLSSETNSIVRFEFGENFDNPPTAVNLGRVGGVSYPTGIYAINDNGFWRVFVINGGDNTRMAGGLLTRLDFGNSLLNTPTGVNLGNPGGVLQHSRDLTIMKSCGQTIGFAVNAHLNYNELVKLDFAGDLSKAPTITSLGNIGNMSFPHSISKLFRSDNDVYGFVTNVDNSTITRLKFEGCSDASISNSILRNPPDITYSQPGVYNINLTIDDGLPTQASVCHQVVVLPTKSVDFTFASSTCNPLEIQFLGYEGSSDWQWDFGDGAIIKGNQNPIHLYAKAGNYKVRLYSNSQCASLIEKIVTISINNADIIRTKDSVICKGASINLNAVEATDYCWTPGDFLNDATIATPIAKPQRDITYYLTAKTLGNNLVVNGDFESGNTGFGSSLNYSSTNSKAGEFNIGSNSSSWNTTLKDCSSHVKIDGKMMIINGATNSKIEVWKQVVNVLPNTNFEFSMWIQSISDFKAASIQLSINGIHIAKATAPSRICDWVNYKFNWNSADATSATISVFHINDENDEKYFALDDIHFAPVVFKTDSIRIEIETPFIKTSNDTAICVGASVPLETVGGITYSWLPLEGLNNSYISNPIALVEKTTQYIVSGRSKNGCSASDTVNISVLPNPTITVSNDTAFCGDSGVRLTASGAQYYSWSPTEGLSDPLVSNPLAVPLKTTHYKVIGRNESGCSSGDSVVLTVLPSLKVSISKDTSICNDQKVQLNAEGGNSFHWSPAEGLSNTEIANPIASPDRSVNYTVRITNSDKCSAVDSVKVYVLPKPVLQLTSDTIICNGSTIELKAMGGASYKWSPSISLNDSNVSNPLATPSSNTIYSVVVKDEKGCSNIDSVEVQIKDKSLFGVVLDNLVSCENQPLQLQAYGGHKFSWAPIEGLSNANIANPIAKLSKSFTYSVTIMDTICNEKEVYLVPISINAANTVPVSKSGDITCNVPTVQLRVNASGESFIWSPSVGLSNPSIANPAASPTVSTLYTVDVVNSNGCSSKGSVFVNVSKNDDFKLYEMPNAFTPNNDGLNDCFGMSKWGAVKIDYFEIYNRWGQLVFTANNASICWDGTKKGVKQPSGTYVFKLKVETFCGVVEKIGNVMLIR
jgi:gliding motility-associated-like protein